MGIVFINYVLSGVLHPIAMCLKDKEHNLKLYALNTLNEMTKENEDLAQAIIDVSTLPLVSNLLTCNTTELKVQVNCYVYS